MKKGFTLIELLVVITIIGILAVVVIPSVLNAPAKARDLQRKTDLTNIAKAIEAGRSDGITIPFGTAYYKCVDDTVFASFKPYFSNGKIPKDPQSAIAVTGLCPNGHYVIYNYQYNTTTSSYGYRYGVFARVEIPETNGNWENCSSATGPFYAYNIQFKSSSPTTICYGIKVNK